MSKSQIQRLKDITEATSRGISLQEACEVLGFIPRDAGASAYLSATHEKTGATENSKPSAFWWWTSESACSYFLSTWIRDLRELHKFGPNAADAFIEPTEEDLESIESANDYYSRLYGEKLDYSQVFITKKCNCGAAKLGYADTHEQAHYKWCELYANAKG